MGLTFGFLRFYCLKKRIPEIPVSVAFSKNLKASYMGLIYDLLK